MRIAKHAIVTAAVVALLVGCSKSSPPANVTFDKYGVDSYGARGADNSWPDIPPGTVAAAPDLAAKNYYIVLDASGSMGDRQCTERENKLAEAVDAVALFTEQIPTDANIGLSVFNGRRIQELAALGTNNRSAIKQSLKGVTHGGGTPLASSIERAKAALQRQAVAQLGNGEFHLVVVTDGAADQGQDPRFVVDNIVSDSPIVVHAIGFCIGDRHALNRPGVTLYTAASDGVSLARGLSSVLAEAPSFDASQFVEIN